MPAPPEFVGGKKPRSRTIPLDFPLRYDGKIYSAVTVRRVTVAELDEFMASAVATREAGGQVDPWPPMFDIPRAVMDALDPDDQDRVSGVAMDFLPQRLLELATAPPSATDEPPLPTGAATPPSSLPPSGGRATP